ncbi:MAG: ATP-dependent DNA helicase [Candidatus Sabulitectum sp.]|nr:ATP-dependent DNA helicase [Candidatus Sabulitectum sp.]
MSLSERVLAVFTDGSAASVIPKYTVRREQVDMASSVADLVELEGISVLEAGTGVGKSFAYLIPAVLSGQACVISTATLTLQDQLISKDIPMVGRILGETVDAAVLKGRSNYLCLRKWFQWGSAVAPELKEWVEEGNGDLSLSDIKLGGDRKRKVAGDGLDCLGSKCSEMHHCHYYIARNKARKARILVVNHHLLLCGLDSGDLIPDAWFLVVDEAHSLDKAASSSLGYSLSEPMLNSVFDSVILSGRTPEKKTILLDKTRLIAAQISDLSVFAGKDGEVELNDILPSLQIIADAASSFRKEISSEEDLSGASQTLQNLERSVLSLTGVDSANWCCYTEKNRKHPVLRCVPVHPGSLLRDTLYSSFPSVLLTSATLAAGNSFSHSDSRLGVPVEAERRIFPSPFNYAEQSVLVLPDDLPGQNDHVLIAEYAWRIASETAAILQGRTMILFTSYRNMELCCKAAEKNPLEGVSLLVQGKMNRSAILERFREDPGAVILGTASFWEGVDLPGELLHSLIIDRIPFPSPGHPLTRARMTALEEKGESSFFRLMLPEAAIRLKQGVGRLIRSGSDTGAVFILDRRMRTSGYAKILLASMPPFRRENLQGAMSFLGRTSVEQANRS